MDSTQYISNIDDLLQGVSASAYLPAVNELLAEVKNRISVDGKNTAGGSIGQYSTKSAYFTKKQFTKQSAFKGTGKSESSLYSTVSIKVNKKTKAITYGKVNKAKRLTGIIGGKEVGIKNAVGFHAEERTSMFLPGGYKELRLIQGRDISKINETYSGSLMLAFQLQVNEKDIVTGMTDKKSALIRAGQEDGTKKMKGRGKIFYASEAELTTYAVNVAEIQAEVITKIMAGAKS